MFADSRHRVLERRRFLDRRRFLEQTSLGFGWLAFNGLVADRSFATDVSLVSPRAAAKAERVVWFFMDGGLSHIDSFDHKPRLVAENGQPLKLPGSSGPTARAARW
jgi:hypothetical protein